MHMSQGRRLLAVAAALLAPCLALAGCSGASSSAAGGTAKNSVVTIDFYYPDQVGTLGTLIDGYLKEFAAQNPDIHVNGVYSGDYDQTLAAVNTAIDANKAPALAIMDQSFMHDLVHRDVVTTWDEYLTSDADKAWLKAFYPQFMSNGVGADGKVYGIPFARSTIVQYWNKNMFKAAGLDPDKPPANWDAVLADAKATQQKAGAKWGVFIPTSTGTAYWLYQALVQQAGGVGAISKAAGNEVTLNSPADVKALQFWASLAKEGVAPSTEVSWSTSTDDFLAGTTAMMWTTSGRMGSIQSKATFDWGVAALPTEVGTGAPTGGGSLMLFKNGVTPEQHQAAVKLAKFLTTPERAADVSINSGYIATSEAAWNTPAMAAYLQKFPQAKAPHDAIAQAIPEMATFERDQVVYQTLAPALQSVLLQGADAQATLAKAQSDIDKILASYR